MKYKVHRIQVNKENMQEKLEQFLNTLSGEIVSVIPQVTTLFLVYGSRISHLLVVEKIA